MRGVIAGAVVSVAFVTAVVAAQPAPQAPPPCIATGNVQFVCGQLSPEDLVVVPGGQWVVASSFLGPGGINLIRVSDRTSVRAYPAPTAREMFDAKTYKSCPGVPDEATKAKFQTHGLSLREGRNGVHTLLTVTHGAREAIDVFTLDTRTPTPTLTWIGCAVAPDPIGLNSVRWLDDGGFIATNFNPRGNPNGFAGLQKGEKNGELWEWHTSSGWQKVPGSEASGANGIEISPDGKTLYVAAWGSQSFFRLSRGEKEPKRDEVPLGFRVDNIRWAADGTLLGTGQAGAPGQPAETVVVRIDPRTLKATEVLRRPAGGGFSAGTVAVEVGKTLWVGSFTGDRIAIFPVP
jgi:hypothetical protein